MNRRGGLALVTACLFACSLPAADPPLQIAKQGYFYAGGRSVNGALADAIFVEYQIPAKLRAPYPVVMIHGQFQNGSNFLGTPDGREGWAQQFLRQGYAVYVIDQAARGRSNYNAAADGPLTLATPEQVERQFTGISQSKLWPQAKLHTQWPGTGLRGDPAFEQFYASQNASMTDNAAMDAANRAAGAALLRKIGPAILMTHSRSGPFGWEIADDVPELVKGIIAVEPNGPPFYNAAPIGATPDVVTRQWALTFGPITYDPPVKSADDFQPKLEAQPQGAGLDRCWSAGVPHKLPRLANIPVLVVTAEASYHAPYEHCTVQFLTQAGVHVEHVPLASRGIHGNGHMMMLEKNNGQIANVLVEWLQKNVSSRRR